MLYVGLLVVVALAVWWFASAPRRRELPSRARMTSEQANVMRLIFAKMLQRQNVVREAATQMEAMISQGSSDDEIAYALHRIDPVGWPGREDDHELVAFYRQAKDRPTIHTEKMLEQAEAAVQAIDRNDLAMAYLIVADIEGPMAQSAIWDAGKSKSVGGNVDP